MRIGHIFSCIPVLYSVIIKRVKVFSYFSPTINKNLSLFHSVLVAFGARRRQYPKVKIIKSCFLSSLFLVGLRKYVKLFKKVEWVKKKIKKLN